MSHSLQVLKGMHCPRLSQLDHPDLWTLHRSIVFAEPPQLHPIPFPHAHVQLLGGCLDPIAPRPEQGSLQTLHCDGLCVTAAAAASLSLLCSPAGCSSAAV